MRVHRRRVNGWLAGAVGLPLVGSRAGAQSWPDGPIALVVPYPAGGPNDLLARVLAKYLSESLGASFIVENRVGAAGNIGAGFVAKARPDGRTLLFTSTGPTANNKFLYPSLPFDPVKDFDSIVLVAKSAVLFTARRDAPFSSITELINAAKADPGKYSIGTAGYGTIAHIASEFFQRSAGIRLTNVPYSGSTPIIQALLGDQIDLASDLIPAHVPLLRDHRYKAIAITGVKRSLALPDIPTVAESGLPTFEATAWSAIMAPAGSPRAAVDRINAAVNAWLASDDGRAQLAQLEMSGEGGAPADLDTFIGAEIAKWGPIIEAAGIKATQ